MMSVSALIDFLMKLLRDDNAKAAFEHDPQGTLSKHGLDGVSGQDVRDARLIMADDGGVRAKPGHSSGSGSRHDDPIREIHHTTTNYVINEGTVVGGDVNIINIDDRDTTVIDSFNSADTTNVDVTAIQDNDVTNINGSSGGKPDDHSAKGEPDGKEHTAGTHPVDGTSSGTPAGGASSGPHSGDTGGAHDVTLITDPVRTDHVGTDHVGTHSVGTDHLGTDHLGTHSVGIDPVHADPVGSGPVESEPVDNGPVDHGPVESEPIDHGPVDHGLVESEPAVDGAGFDAAVI